MCTKGFSFELNKLAEERRKPWTTKNLSLYKITVHVEISTCTEVSDYHYSEDCWIFLNKTWCVCQVFDINIVKIFGTSSHNLNLIYHIWDILKNYRGFSWQNNLSILTKFNLRIIFCFRQIKVSKIDAR
jgi:hypothetical protein